MPWTPAQTRSQFAAVAWLRWRIFVNAFRRKGGAGELVARILVWPILAGMTFGPTILAGFAAYYFASTGRLDRISFILWITFGLCQLLNIQLGQPGTTFDPTQLIRFPLALSDYTAIRLFFGVLSPANIIGSLISLAIAIGVTIAIPTLWVASLVALFLFAAVNVLFSRMVFAWVDRWLSTRRAREIFTALIFAFSLGIQWVNFTYNPAYNRHKTIQDPGAKLSALANLYARVQPLVHFLPPGLTSASLVAIHKGQPLPFLGDTLAVALFGAVFLAIFTLRMKTEFRGENLSDVANAVAKAPGKKTLNKPKGKGSEAAAITPPAADLSHLRSPSAGRTTPFRVPNVIAGVLGKEILFLRRNTGLFYAIIAPIVFVFLFAGRLAGHSSGAAWIFPAAVAYSLLGITPLAYNSFGLEAAGAQFYFLAPIRFRDVFLAKNLINFAIALLEIAAVFGIITYVATMPDLQTVAIALLWAFATILVSTTVGNRRSISAPKKVNPGRAANKQASPLSSLIGMGIFLGSGAIAASLYAAAFFLHLMWILIPVFALLFAGALWLYLASLGSLDRYALDHREQMFAELCKAG